jgi:hypothetical protein
VSDIVSVVTPAPMSISTQVTAPASTVTIVGAGQGVAGKPGDKGEPGEGIQNFTGDPVAAYILARN